MVEIGGVEKARAPLHMLEGVITFGRPGASPALLAACAETGITMSFLQPNGRFLARVEGIRTGNVLLRRTQHRTADDAPKKTVIVRAIVAAKAANQRTVLRRALRDSAADMDPHAAASIGWVEQRLTDMIRRTLAADGVDELRGLEGEAAPRAISTCSGICYGATTAPSPFPAGRADRRWTASMPCCRFSMPCSGMIAARRWRATAWTRRSAFFMPTDPAARAWRSI